MTKHIFTPSVPGFDELFKKAVQERADFIVRNKELLIAAWVAQHGWHPDECTLIQQDMQDGSIKMWVEKRGEFEELKRFREREKLVQRLLRKIAPDDPLTNEAPSPHWARAVEQLARDVESFDLNPGDVSR